MLTIKNASLYDGMSPDFEIEKELIALGYSSEFARIAAEFDIYRNTAQKTNDGKTVYQKTQLSEDASDLQIIKQHENTEGQLPEYIEVGESNPNYEFDQLSKGEQNFNMEAEDRLNRYKEDRF